MTFEPISCILPAEGKYGGLYIGNFAAARSRDILQEHKIGAILNVAVLDDIPNYFADEYAYGSLSLDDDPGVSLRPYLLPAYRFIHKWRLKRKRNVLVHCMAGRSRSVALVAAYLMRAQRLSADEALTLIQSKRAIANPNSGFVRQLRELDWKLITRHHM